MQKIRTIRLYGKLGAKFGRVHHLAVNSTREAMRALCSLVPGFEQELLSSADRGIRYACFLGTRNIGEKALAHPPGNDDIRIAPVLQGSKQAGLLQTIIGGVLVAASFVPGLQVLAPVGISMMAGGVLQMLSPSQTGLAAKDSPDNGASYNMNGAVNVQAQGNPEPVAWGEVWAGSVLVSGGIYAEDQQ
jgi:predicted phage tail protein